MAPLAVSALPTTLPYAPSEAENDSEDEDGWYIETRDLEPVELPKTMHIPSPGTTKQQAIDLLSPSFIPGQLYGFPITTSWMVDYVSQLVKPPLYYCGGLPDWSLYVFAIAEDITRRTGCKVMVTGCWLAKTIDASGGFCWMLALSDDVYDPVEGFPDNEEAFLKLKVLIGEQVEGRWFMPI